jgi:hypothetical protein
MEIRAQEAAVGGSARRRPMPAGPIDGTRTPRPPAYPGHPHSPAARIPRPPAADEPAGPGGWPAAEARFRERPGRIRRAPWGRGQIPFGQPDPAGPGQPHGTRFSAGSQIRRRRGNPNGTRFSVGSQMRRGRGLPTGPDSAIRRAGFGGCRGVKDSGVCSTYDSDISLTYLERPETARDRPETISSDGDKETTNHARRKVAAPQRRGRLGPRR